MFELLMQLPLFQGVSAATLSTIVEKYKFHFLKYHDGEVVVDAGDVSTHVRFVVSGAVRTTTSCRHLNVSLSQTLAAPHVLGPDTLFGVNTTYPFTATALDTCGILQIAKADYVTMLQTDKVFLFNILNYLSRGTQVLTSTLLDVEHADALERLVRWVEPLTTRTSIDVALRFTQKDLCQLLGVSRKALMTALDTLSSQGVITHSAHELGITDLRKFTSCKSKSYQQ